MIDIVGDAPFEQELITIGNQGEVFRVEYEPYRSQPTRSAMYFDPRRLASLEVVVCAETGALAGLVYRVTQPQERVGMDGNVALPIPRQAPAVPKINLAVFQKPPLTDRDNLSVAIGNGGLVLMVGAAWSHDKTLHGVRAATFWWKDTLSRVSLFRLNPQEVMDLERCAFQ